ncbi:MAG TPA: Asd/ArgC dimerization domain-containing protein, partial [Bacilli bacterium]|nr:Asd/ArgC dimerization domain-containing protein [Bacilli bacterium]
DLMQQTKAVLAGEDVKPESLPVSSLPKKHQMAFNVVPQIDVATENGFTKEEMKMVNETRKIFSDQEILVTPTCVRVPVLYGHSEAVYLETKSSFELEEVRELLSQAQGIVVIDDLDDQEYPMPVQTADTLDVYVGRIRRDLFHPRGLNLWIVSDNVLKGAAWNAVQIAEYMVKNR